MQTVKKALRSTSFFSTASSLKAPFAKAQSVEKEKRPTVGVVLMVIREDLYNMILPTIKKYQEQRFY